MGYDELKAALFNELMVERDLKAKLEATQTRINAFVNQLAGMEQLVAESTKAPKSDKLPQTPEGGQDAES